MAAIYNEEIKFPCPRIKHSNSLSKAQDKYISKQTGRLSREPAPSETKGKIHDLGLLAEQVRLRSLTGARI